MAEDTEAFLLWAKIATSIAVKVVIILHILDYM
jgi:hypothetical protein